MKMPKINIIDDDSLNAFASGIDEKSYSITVSKGIIEKLNDEELEGVIAHKLSHEPELRCETCGLSINNWATSRFSTASI